MNFEERYGTLDRLLYRIAFRGGTAQHAMADVEEMMFEDELEAVSAGDPVFITSLPRAGTTILLKLLWNSGAFASHTYRDMPFVLCPLLWNQFSRQFADGDVTRERAHGDGLQVSGTSPEAFEDMVWKHFWPEHYRDDHIRPWTPDDQNRAFNAFFETHIRKVIAVRRDERPEAGRYLSKNNLNIARLAAPPAPLRRGTFLIPFRDPVQQAASMYRQHERFLDIHESDDFVREYMEAIGHHEFGKGLRPVNFDGWLADASDPSDLAFWVEYWGATYQHVLEHAGDGTVLVSYARLTEAPVDSLARLAEALALPADTLTAQADDLRPPRTHPVDRTALPDALLRETTKTYEALDQHAAV
jgi:hypothetical protein